MEKYLLSNTNEFRYKNISLFVQVDAKVGGKIASTTHQYGSQYGNYESTLFGAMQHMVVLPIQTQVV